MKSSKLKYAIGLLGLLFFTTACEEEKPDFFDSSANSIYFDYENSEDFKQSVRFQDEGEGFPETKDVVVKVKLLGYIEEGTRSATLKAKPVEGYPEIETVLPDVNIDGKEYETEITVSVACPEDYDVEHAVCLYFDNGDASLSGGVEGYNEYIIYVKKLSSYEQPPHWTDDATGIVMYLGTWDPDKHAFFVKLLGDKDFADLNKLNDFYNGTILRYNELAVAELRRQYNETGEPVKIAIPFNRECNYEKPVYWNDSFEKYFTYSSATFADLANAAGANTSNEVEILGNVSPESMHKLLVYDMMEKYNMYFTEWAVSVIYFRNNCYFEMFEDVEYDVVQPICWSPEGDGAGEKPTKYYGEYSDEKYKFMIKTWLKHQNEAGKEFMLWQMFPLVKNYATMDADWDSMAGGEKAMRECYKVFKEAYDAAPAGTYNFTFPVIELE